MSATAIMAGIGAVASLAGAVGGTIKSAIYGNRARKLIADQRRENRDWYRRRMAEDYTMRSDAQAAIKRQRELLEEQYKRAKAMNVVAGGTDQALAMQQSAANKSVADTMTGIAANASAWKDNIESAYRQQDAALNQQQAAGFQQQSAAVAQAGSQVANAGINLLGNSIHEMGQDKVNKILAENGEDPNNLYRK